MDGVWAGGLNIQLISCFTKKISEVNKALMRQGSGIRIGSGQLFLTNLLILKRRKMIQQQEKDWDEEFECLIAIAKTKQLAKEEQIQLLNEIRNGTKDGIIQLVDSWDVVILSIAKQLASSTMKVEEMLTIGRKELFKLAEMEVNSEIDERFFKLGAWCVKQSIMLEIKNENNKQH